MPLSVVEAEDSTLEDATEEFVAQTSHLTQSGAKDHPTDCIVLYDTAATLALELGAEPADHRASSLTRAITLPGSGNTFAITVDRSGHANYKIEHDGRAGDNSALGASQVLSFYAALLGHPPSQDELAGFIAARIAGEAAPRVPGRGPAAVTTVTARASDGTVLATGTPAAVLAAMATLVVLNDGVMPSLDLPGQPPLQNATQAAACLLVLTIQAGTTTAATIDTYNQTVSWFDQIDQPMLDLHPE